MNNTNKPNAPKNTLYLPFTGLFLLRAAEVKRWCSSADVFWPLSHIWGNIWFASGPRALWFCSTGAVRERDNVRVCARERGMYL